MSAQPTLAERPQADPAAHDAPKGPPSSRPRARLLRRLLAASRTLYRVPALQSTTLRVGLGIVLFFVAVALVAPLLIHQNPTAFSTDQLQPPSWRHWLGTTQTGQDIFAQVALGARATLVVGFA